jgi:hypothetical protein
MVRVGLQGKDLVDVRCSVDGIEASIIETKTEQLITLVNWTNQMQKDLAVSMKMSQAPKSIWCVRTQKTIPHEYNQGMVIFKMDLADADYFIIK